MSIFDVFKRLENEKIISSSDFSNTGKPEFIIAGLGNPGTRYENTRHNAGFMVVDRLAKRLFTPVKKVKFKSLTCEAEISAKRCLMMKPTTFMNLSGQAVSEAMAFYKIPPENVIVIFDDITGKVGNIKIKRGGSDGGHNGMKNIIYLTGKDTFPRIKIGVGEKPHPDFDLADWVTSPFKKEEGELLEKSLDNAANAVEMILKDGLDAAMNLYNRK